MHTSTFGFKLGSLSPAVSLKIRSRSPKPNQLFIMSECYIHANVVKMHPPVHEISCKKESVTPTPTGSAPKPVCSCPLRGGGGIIKTLKFSEKIITSIPCVSFIEHSLFKNIFEHKFCICQPIFKIFVAHFTTNLVLTIVQKILCLPPINYEFSLKFILRGQKQHNSS